MKKSTTAFATLCSLALCLWAYQAGVWLLAIPMVLVLEARALIKPRWKISWEHFQAIHVLAAFTWLLSIFNFPINSPSPVAYGAGYHILKCLPIGLFPLIVCQTYCVNFTSFYKALFKESYRSDKCINLYYPYFGICLLAASVTGGNTVLFLAITAVLVAGFLGSLRSPRFSAIAFYGLIGLALVLSLVGTHQFYWLKANVKLKSPDLFNDLTKDIASLSTQNENQNREQKFNTDFLNKAKERIKNAPVSASQSSIAQSNQRTEASQNTQTAPSTTQPTQAPESTPSPGAAQSSTPSAEIAESAQSTGTTPSPTQATQAAGSLPNMGAASGVGTSESGTQGTQSTGTAPSTGASQSGTQPSGDIASSQQPHQQGGGNENIIGAATSTQGDTPSVEGSENTQGTTSAQNAGQTGVGTNQNNPSSSLQATNQDAHGTRSQPLPSLVQEAGGVVDPQKSVTQIGNTGALQPSDAILFRVKPNAGLGTNRREPTFPLYIREATYNQYASGAWDAVQPKNTSQDPSSTQQHWIFGPQTPPTTSQTASVRISAALQRREETLKLPMGTFDIDNLSVDSMQVNQYGTVTVQGKPGEISYTVQFDPTQSLDSPPTSLDMAIPQAEQPTMQTVIASLNLKGKSASATVQAISAFFTNNFQYSLLLPPSQKNTTPLSTFLLGHRSGHCEYFASATSLLLRSAGIPTRYVVGYSVHEYSPSEQQYIVRARNAHAWVTAYINGSWITVDTTPASGVLSNGNASTASAGKQVPNAKQVPNGDVSKTSALGKPTTVNAGKVVSQVSPAQKIKSFSEKISEAWSTLPSNFSKRSDTLLWAGGIIALGLAIIFCTIFFVWSAIRKNRPQRSKWRRRSPLDRSSPPMPDGLDSEFYLIEKRLGEWGLERQSSETVRQWILRLKQKLPEAKMNDLNQIIDLHYCYRFDPQGIDQEDRLKLRSMIQCWLVETTA
jgi:protein-glutamine gamma-glutamyltransferase